MILILFHKATYRALCIALYAVSDVLNADLYLWISAAKDHNLFINDNKWFVIVMHVKIAIDRINLRHVNECIRILGSLIIINYVLNHTLTAVYVRLLLTLKNDMRKQNLLPKSTIRLLCLWFLPGCCHVE